MLSEVGSLKRRDGFRMRLQRREWAGLGEDEDEAERLREMAALIENGGMRPLVDQVLPLEDVGTAHERLDSGHGTGKIILQVTEG